MPLALGNWTTLLRSLRCWITRDDDAHVCFIFAASFGPLFGVEPPGQCTGTGPCIICLSDSLQRWSFVVIHTTTTTTTTTNTTTLRSHFGSSGHYCSNGSLLQREPKVLLRSLTRMVLVSHGNVCRALLVSLLSRFGAVSAVDSQFGFWSVCLEVPSFVEMIPSRSWRFLDVPSLLNVCPSPVSLVEEWMAMAALSLLQFGNPGMPSFLGDFFGAGCFMFKFKGLLWSFMVPVVVAAAIFSDAAMPVLRGCGAARPLGSGLCPPGSQLFSLAAIALLSVLASIFCSGSLDTGSLDLETDFDHENFLDTFLGSLVGVKV